MRQQRLQQVGGRRRPLAARHLRCLGPLQYRLERHHVLTPRAHLGQRPIQRRQRSQRPRQAGAAALDGRLEVALEGFEHEGRRPVVVALDRRRREEVQRRQGRCRPRAGFLGLSKGLGGRCCACRRRPDRELADGALGRLAHRAHDGRDDDVSEAAHGVNAVNAKPFGTWGGGRREEFAKGKKRVRAADEGAVVFLTAGGGELTVLDLELAAELQAARHGAGEAERLPQAGGHVSDLVRLGMFLEDVLFELRVAGVEGRDLGVDLGDDVGAGVVLALGVGEEGQGGAGGQHIDVRVDLLNVEEDAREGGREVEGGVAGVVGGEHERIGEGGGREAGVEEGLVVDV